MRGDCCEDWDGYGFASLAANLCSGGRGLGGVAEAMVGSLLGSGEGVGACVIMAFPSLVRAAQVVW